MIKPGNFLIPIEAHASIKQFGKLTAVNNLDFQIAQGEFFGILGPNSAGKTTTMQMLASSRPPQAQPPYWALNPSEKVAFTKKRNHFQCR